MRTGTPGTRYQIFFIKIKKENVSGDFPDGFFTKRFFWKIIFLKIGSFYGHPARTDLQIHEKTVI
jgi:hypothetical protein